jgi:hypothetical protein
MLQLVIAQRDALIIFSINVGDLITCSTSRGPSRIDQTLYNVPSNYGIR